MKFLKIFFVAFAALVAAAITEDDMADSTVTITETVVQTVIVLVDDLSASRKILHFDMPTPITIKPGETVIGNPATYALSLESPTSPALSMAVPTSASNTVPSDAVSSIGSEGEVEELKTIVHTIDSTTTQLSTLTDGVVVTSVTVIPITSTSVNILEVEETTTSTTTKHMSLTITKTEVVRTTSAAFTSHIPVIQDISQMWGLNEGEKNGPSIWMAVGLVLLTAAHYLWFLHH